MANKMMNIFGINFDVEEVTQLGLKETAGGSPRFEESFVGEVEIIKAEMNEAKTGSKSLQLTVREAEGEKEQSYLNIWFAKADGSQISMGLSKIMALSGLTKMKPEFFNKPELLEGSKVGVFMKVTDEGKKFLQHDLEGFYSVKANLTWGELKAGLSKAEGKLVEKMKARYEETPVFISKDYEENKAKANEEAGVAASTKGIAPSEDIDDVM